MAGEQEVMNLAYSQEIVVTVPGNTRFFIVLQQGAGREGAKSQLLPAGSRGQRQHGGGIERRAAGVADRGGIAGVGVAEAGVEPDVP